GRFVHPRAGVGIDQVRELRLAAHLDDFRTEAAALLRAGVDRRVEIELRKHLAYEAAEGAGLVFVQLQPLLRLLPCRPGRHGTAPARQGAGEERSAYVDGAGHEWIP